MIARSRNLFVRPSMVMPLCSIIIVTYNSEKFIEKCLDCIYKQTYRNYKVMIVDSGSQDRTYLSSYDSRSDTGVFFAGDQAGFCRANNYALARISPETDYVFFLNPDAFISPTYLEEALLFMEKSENRFVGALTGVTLGYDIRKDKPTGLYDTTGIFHTWYGRWFDRDQGREYKPDTYFFPEEIPAICGAVFLCRKVALESTYLRPFEALDESFYMYKEDIDLSRRLRKQGWRLVFLPGLIAYHCRGWDQNRKKMPKQLRLISARNECWVHLRLRSILGFIYSAIKYAAVRILNV